VSEIEFWRSIKESLDATDFEEYLKHFPEGEFVQLAKNAINLIVGAAQ